MLKKLRIIISIIIFALLTLYFLDFAGILPDKIHVLGHIQFVPALMSRGVVIVACLVIGTLIFGRLYCSVICPMGIFQDIVSRCSKVVRPKEKYIYRRNNPALRWSIVAVSLILFFSGITAVIGALDPYGAYGRIAVHVFKPVYMFANNIAASVLGNFGNYTLYKVDITVFSVFSLCVALVTFTVIGVSAWTMGRMYCNTICPVGTVLGLVNKFSLFKIRLNDKKCVSCGICAGVCKASCIDMSAKSVDYTRCVNCFNCIGSCGKRGITFSINRPPAGTAVFGRAPVDTGKRNFLLMMGLGAVAAPKVLAQSLAGSAPRRTTAISPPGSTGAERLLRRCTSCHLCVSKCPSKALKPAFMEYGIGGIMMPMMHFDKGFCNYDCTVCAGVCPSRALLPLTKEQKHRLQVGKVIFIPELCVVHTNGTSCGACAEHCPTQAVTMVPYKDGLTIPRIDVDICVGCGGCEYICPVRPTRAIFVEGNKVHQAAKPFVVEKHDVKEITDFGF